MISDEKRREVAKKLRETCDEIERTGNGLTVWELTDILAIRDDDSGMIESLNLDDARNLADLIDRPTCEMAECSIDHGSRSWGMRCSRCGTEFEHEKPAYGWSYCPNCGARVVMAND